MDHAIQAKQSPGDLSMAFICTTEGIDRDGLRQVVIRNDKCSPGSR